MNDYEKGTQTARGWKAKKYYLSDEAIALLMEHCSGTPLTMSAYLDGLIKRELDSPAEQFLRAQPVAEVTKVLEEGQRQIEELTAPTATEVVARIAEHESNTGRPPRDPREPLGAFQSMKPAKKDFDIDL